MEDSAGKEADGTIRETEAKPAVAGRNAAVREQSGVRRFLALARSRSQGPMPGKIFAKLWRKWRLSTSASIVMLP